MSIPKLNEDLNIIQKLSDLPNSADGLNADQLKAKFDKAANIIQKWVNETLVEAIKAAEIPFAPTEEIGADNIQNAIELVQEHTRLASSGTILPGSITKEKLHDRLLSRTYGGRVWVSDNEPSQDNNVAADFPIGQLWLSSDKKMWAQLQDGQWWPMVFDPDEGKDNMFLQYINGQKVWSDKETAIANLGSLRIETGTYVGTGAPRTEELTVTPKVIIIHPKNGPVYEGGMGYWDNPVVLSSGAVFGGTTYVDNGKSYNTVSLTNATITFDGRLCNRADETYTWTAIY